MLTFITSMQCPSCPSILDSSVNLAFYSKEILQARSCIAGGLLGIGATIAMSVIADDCFHGGDRFSTTCRNTPVQSCHTYTTGSGSHKTSHTVCHNTGRNYSSTEEGKRLAIGAAFIAATSVLLIVKGVSIYLEVKRKQQELAERFSPPSVPSANDPSVSIDL